MSLNSSHWVVTDTGNGTLDAAFHRGATRWCGAARSWNDNECRRAGGPLLYELCRKLAHHGLHLRRAGCALHRPPLHRLQYGFLRVGRVYLIHSIILITIRAPGPRFNIKMSSYQYRKSHCEDKTVVRSSHIHNGISYIGTTISLYWIAAQISTFRSQRPCCCSGKCQNQHPVSI